MTRLKKAVVFFAILILTGITFYPPWVYTYQKSGISQVQEPAGYHLIYNPPDPKYDAGVDGVILDSDRYLYQVFGIVVLFGGIYLILPGNQNST